MIDIQPVHGVPALTIDDSTMVIGDLHIGVESHLRKKGFHLVSHTNDMLDSIIDSSGEASRLVVIGDVKDSVPGSSKQEYAEIPDFFERLLEIFDMIDVVRGNHDTGIEEFLPKHVNVRPATGLVIGDIGLVHGHTWPSNEVMACETLIMAHNHPTVMFRDGVGRQMTEPCWLRGSFQVDSNDRYLKLPERFVLVPAFNRMLGGSPINTLDDELLGPIMNSGLLNLDDARIYLLDGIDLGKRSELMIKGRSTGRWKDAGKERNRRRAKYS